jgi:hypothetical protein
MPESANALLEGQGPGLSFNIIDVILSHSGKHTCVGVVYVRQNQDLDADDYSRKTWSSLNAEN